MPFKILDDIDSLMKFNWASVVHKFLVNELSRAYMVHRQNKNEYNITLAGSVVVLQVIRNFNYFNMYFFLHQTQSAERADVGDDKVQSCDASDEIHADVNDADFGENLGESPAHDVEMGDISDKIQSISKKNTIF